MENTRRFEEIPAGLDEIEPGPILAVLLSGIDVTRLSGHDRITVLRADQRMASHFTARTYRDMASVPEVMDEAGSNPQSAEESAAAEIRAALRLTRRAADSELVLALALQRRLSRVWEALQAGSIDVRRARTIDRATVHLPDDSAQAVVDRVIERAPQLTTGQLQALIGKLCIEVDPEDAARRYEDAVRDRRVVTEPTDAGTANLLGLDLPPHRVAAVTRRINQMAQSLRGEGESRTMDQLRADVFMDILSGTAKAGKRGSGVVDIRVDLETLTKMNDAPGDLAGYGSIIADIARRVADDQHDAEWRYTVTHPESDQPLYTGVTRRRPTADQRRRVESRNPTCVFPGCRMPSTGCDLDHRIPWAEGGPTAEWNLAPGCRHDHIIRHRYGWTYVPLINGDYLWTSRLGHVYTTSGRPP